MSLLSLFYTVSPARSTFDRLIWGTLSELHRDASCEKKIVDTWAIRQSAAFEEMLSRVTDKQTRIHTEKYQ